MELSEVLGVRVVGVAVSPLELAERVSRGRKEKQPGSLPALEPLVEVMVERSEAEVTSLGIRVTKCGELAKYWQNVSNSKTCS